jgi:antitoxin component of MazEF toxin-antitoxin module
MTTDAPRASFRTTILSSGGTAAGIEVPPEAVEALGAGKQPRVVVTLNGYSYRNAVAVMSGTYMIGVSNEHRAASGLKAGDEVDVELVLDTALDAEPAARATFDKLSPSLKGYHVGLVEGAKTEETRQRRIEKAVATLREGKPR